MKIQRRKFLKSISIAALGTDVATDALLDAGNAKNPGLRRELFSLDDTQIKLYIKKLSEPVKVLMIADTHLSINDERGEPYRQYSGRMAQYYKKTIHFKTGQPTTPEESFEKMIQMARDTKVDMLALNGDIFSFPSEAAIEWVHERLIKSGLPYFFVAGNHDWHYEGMEGSAIALREEWTRKRLLPLYQNKHPMMSYYDVKGIRLVILDNSLYEILPEQLNFFKEQVRTGIPLALFVHIPLYAPGRDVGFGCGHPDWGWDTDKHYSFARLPRWPKGGHSKVTMDFHREVFSAPNLLGIFAGHIHRQSLDSWNGVPQFVSKANAEGAFFDIQFVPVS